MTRLRQSDRYGFSCNTWWVGSDFGIPSPKSVPVGYESTQLALSRAVSAGIAIYPTFWANSRELACLAAWAFTYINNGRTNSGYVPLVMVNITDILFVEVQRILVFRHYKYNSGSANYSPFSRKLRKDYQWH